MRRHIRRTKQVRQDIIEIYRYIHERSPQAAEFVMEAIEKSVKSLLATPGLGRRWESPSAQLDGMRVCTVSPYRSYLIFFRAVNDGIEVYRVIHGARKLERIVDEIDIDFDGY